MTATTTRRALLKAAPMIAASAMLASTAAAAGIDTDFAGWEHVKANLRLANARHAATSDRYCEAEAARSDLDQSAPERELTYTAEGFTEGAVTLASYRGTFQLTRHNYQAGHIPSPVKASPEYATFCSDLEAWLATPEHLNLVRAEEQAQQDDADAWQAFKKAWHAVAEYPVGSPALIAEKMAIVTPDAVADPDWLHTIVTAVAADLARISGENV